MRHGTRPGYSRPQSPGWWQRNWKWVVPVGCLGMLFMLVAFVGVIVVIVFGAIKSSEPVKYAYGVAKNDARVHAGKVDPISGARLSSFMVGAQSD